MEANATDGPREYNFDDFHEGQTFVSTLDVTAETLAALVRILDYRSGIVTSADTAQRHGFAREVVPPAYAAAYQFVAAVPGVLLAPGGIYAKQEFKMQGPCHVGDRLVTHTTVREKYIKRGRKYIVFDSQTNLADGTPVIWGRRTRVWPR